jgi:hypothetical protein
MEARNTAAKNKQEFSKSGFEKNGAISKALGGRSTGQEAQRA